MRGWWSRRSRRVLLEFWVKGVHDVHLPAERSSCAKGATATGRQTTDWVGENGAPRVPQSGATSLACTTLRPYCGRRRNGVTRSSLRFHCATVWCTAAPNVSRLLA